VLAGAFLFAVAWLGVTAIFALYVNTIANYGATYGTLAGVAGLLVWFYFSALVLVLGAELTGWLIEPT
jgi:membrane protein